MTLQTVGVVGAGVMGTGVAQNLAQSKYQVRLIDVSDERLGAARAHIRNDLRLHAMLHKRASAEPIDDVLSRVMCSTDYRTLGDVDFVIENVTEDWPTKAGVYRAIDGICRPGIVFAANTSVIPITKIAAITSRCDSVLGIHFMNPVPMKHTVEVIRGHHTSAEAIDAAKQLLTGMGKEGIVVNDSPGFVSNRVLMLTVNEAVFLVHEHVASVEDVDRIFRECFGHKMGPLETADLIGLDTILASLEELSESFGNKFGPCVLLRRMVDAGLHGRKSGRGFYTYEN